MANALEAGRQDVLYQLADELCAGQCRDVGAAPLVDERVASVEAVFSVAPSAGHFAKALTSNTAGWTVPNYIASMRYMKAVLIARTKDIRSDGAIVEVVVWELSQPLPPCTHNFKYRLDFGTPEAARVRYDNERGKGDHRHEGGREAPYAFTSLDTLLDDFERDIQDWSST